MIKFISKILIFAVLVFVCVLLTEMMLKNIPNEYSLKRSVIENNGGQIQTLILGHSQTYHGLNPEYMGDSVFNCASPLQMPYYDYELLKRHISDMPNLKCVIWPLCDFFGEINPHFSGRFEPNYRNYLICMWNKYFDIPPIDANRYLLWPELFWSHWKGPSFTRILSNYFDENKPVEESNYNGWEPQDSHAPDFTPSDVADVSIVSDNLDKEYILVQQENIDYARKIAQICQDNNLQLMVITLPCHASHNLHVRTSDLNVMDSCIKVMQTVNKSVKYYDYSNDNRFTPDDFYDGAHLNTFGAKKISIIIGNILHSKDI